MTNENEAPFVFGVRVEGNTFTDRKEETNRLKMNFLYGVNTILISPRRMGKTSLVEKVCSLVESDTLKIAKIDAFGCRSENDFINAFATAVVRATSSKWEEWMEMNFSIALEYNRANTVTEDILQLPETIAKQKGIKIVICIDEFQQIADFPDSITFQKKTQKRLATPEQRIVLPLRKQKAHDGEDVSEPESSFLQIWRFILSGQNLGDRLG